MTAGTITPAMRRRAPAVAIAALALAASATGLGNGFAFDDTPIIVDNPAAHSLRQLAYVFLTPYWPAQYGRSLYRPLTSLCFALEWAVSRGSALPFHLVSVLLYLAASIAVYRLARQLLSPGAAWLAAALFAVHPVHVEAVANVVGQSELLVALVVALAVTGYVTRRGTEPDRALPAGAVLEVCALYLVGCLVKEHAIVLPGLLLVAEMTVVADPRGWRARMTTAAPVAAGLAAVGAAYLGARAAVLHGLVGDSPTIAFRGATWLTRWWTMLGVVPEWIRLLVWPAHLAAIYGPPATAVRSHADLVAATGLFVLLALGAYAVVLRRRAPVIAFGIAWTAVALVPVSNIVIPSGVLLAERTLFLPSIGAVLAIAGAAAALAPRVARSRRRWRLAVTAAGLILAAGLVRSALRQRIWRDDTVLFAQSVRDEPESYAAHFANGDWLYMNGMRGAGERETGEALRLYADDPRAYAWMGIRYAGVGHCQYAEPLLARAVELAPQFSEARGALARCFRRDGNWAAVRAVATAGVAQGIDVSYYRALLHLADTAGRGTPVAQGVSGGRGSG